MKKYIITAAIAACLALCAAVWPQAETVEGKIPMPSPTPAVSAQQATVAELQTEVETTLPAEEEKAETPQEESPQEVFNESEPAPIETLAAPEVQPMPEPKPVAESASESAPTQPPVASQTSEMVYVPGFGWIESQGPNHVEYAEDMYENGNKIGSMG